MKIVFISFHNYVTKSQGGFHIFAKEMAKDNEVVFFTYPRSWFVYLRKQYRDTVYDELDSIIKYPQRVDNVLNVTSLFFLLPKKILRFLPDCIIELSHRLTLGGFKRFCMQYFQNADCFVFESTPSVYLEKAIRKLFPNSKIVYRPSDPLVANKLLSLYHKKEIEFMMNADMNFIVNKEGLELYKSKIPNFEQCVRYTILSNGVNIQAFTKHYAKPDLLRGEKTAVYVGAAPIEWNLAIESALALPDVDFYIISPAKAPKYFLERVDAIENLHFINGIFPQEVPAYVTNAKVILVPYQTDRYKNFTFGVTAKYYQAMVAKKQIIAYQDTHDLERFEIKIADTYEQFIHYLKETNFDKEKTYDFDFKSKEWSSLAKKMLEIIKEL